MKRVFLVHGWDGYPENYWFPWVKRALEKSGFWVNAIRLPHPEHPTIHDWVSTVEKEVGVPDKETFLVGHSIGCQTILRYLARIDTKIGGIVLVAGYITDLILETEEEKMITKEWMKTPLDFDKVKKNVKHIVALFSDDDPFVPLTNATIMREKLGAKIIIEKNQGHFDDLAKKSELPAVVEEIKKMI